MKLIKHSDFDEIFLANYMIFLIVSLFCACDADFSLDSVNCKLHFDSFDHLILPHPNLVDNRINLP